MITHQTNTISPSTSIERPVLRKGQIENQDQIREGQVFFVYGPEDFKEKVFVIRGPFKENGCLCIRLASKGGLFHGTIALEGLSIVKYQNGTWNVNYWLARH